MIHLGKLQTFSSLSNSLSVSEQLLTALVLAETCICSAKGLQLYDRTCKWSISAHCLEFEMQTIIVTDSAYCCREIIRGKEEIYKAQIAGGSLAAVLLATVAFTYMVQLPGGFDSAGGSLAYAQGGSLRAAFVAFVFLNTVGLVASLYCVLFPATIGPWVTYQYFKQSERICHVLYIACGALFAGYLSAVYIAFSIRDGGHIFSSITIAISGVGVLLTCIYFRKGFAKRCRSFIRLIGHHGPSRRFRPLDDRYRRWARG